MCALFCIRTTFTYYKSMTYCDGIPLTYVIIFVVQSCLLRICFDRDDLHLYLLEHFPQLCLNMKECNAAM